MSLPTEKEYELLTELLLKLKPDIIGISLRSSFFRIATTATIKIREKLSVPIIWGGTHPTIAPEECIQIADIVCIGEGEQTMMELSQYITNGQDIRNIKNLWVRETEQIFRNPVRPPIQDLDNLPFPDYGAQNKYFIENESVSSHDPALDTFNFDIMASRGCPYRCTYCCNSIFIDIIKGKGKVIRRRSVDNVLREIRAMKHQMPKLSRIDFIDEVFAWDKKWVKEFLDKYKKEFNLPFQCAQHPNMVDLETLTMLKDAGLERIEVGLQSGSEDIRKEIFQRPVSDKALINISQSISKLNITPFYDLIVDNPFETDEDKRQSLEFILKLSRPFHLRMYPLTYFPNTKLTKMALRSKLISEDQVESVAERTHNKWFVTLDYPWSNRERFWISLFSLTSKGFMPKVLIKFCSQRRILMKYPKILSSFATLANNIKLGTIAVKWILEGKPLKAILRQTSKGRSHWQI
jgi:radical SAM superfamily enzyme YgiQ (UPF0313 family)